MLAFTQLYFGGVEVALFLLAFTNVKRRLTRSILSFLAVAVAAAVLTTGLSISHGTTPKDQWKYRDYFEGDIVVFSPGFTVPSSSESAFVRYTLADSGFNPLLRFYPEFAQSGYYAEESWEYRPFSMTDIHDLLSHPEVTNVTPHFVMPATLPNEGRDVSLRVFPESKAWQREQWTGAGAGIDTDFDVIVNAWGGSSAIPGDILVVHMPFFKIDALGVPYVDWGAGFRAYHARVVGRVAMKTRMMEFSSLGQEQGYLHAPEVYLSMDTWHELWRNQAGGAEYGALAVALTVQDMGLLNLTTRALRESYPHWTITTVPALVEYCYRYFFLDHFYVGRNQKGESTDQKYLAQQELGNLGAMLLFLITGMLMAFQMSTSAAERRSEIGILKAIGARRSDITGMIITEVVLLAITGGVTGFTLVKVAGIHQALANKWAIGEIIRLAGSEMFLVLGVTVMTSLLFGILPARRIANHTVMEVFRNEK